MPDDIDEVALNVLLAEGLDLPTAIEASRLNDREPPEPGSWTPVVWIIIGLALVIGAAILAL
jgi:hypothetical protein